MDFFKEYVSDTIAGSGNQYIFSSPQTQTGRVFYRINETGRQTYAFLFSNILDSTYASGDVSHKNLVCEEWTVEHMSVSVFPHDFFENIDLATLSEKQITQGSAPVSVTFDGNLTKTVHPGEFFNTDGVELTVNFHDYLCLEITFHGETLPYHEESIIPAYRKNGDTWSLCKQMPYVGMIGVKKPEKKRVAFIGDSITQGCGTGFNAYEQWNAALTDMLADRFDRFAFWNLGIGYARADDAATDSAWMYKAKHNDAVAVCFGVNDILQGFTAEQIKKNLETIVDTLHKNGIKVFLQSVPPFDYSEEKTKIWNDVNDFVVHTLKPKVEGFFDNDPVLRLDEAHPQKTQYGSHPNGIGCKAWAQALYPSFSEFLATL